MKNIRKIILWLGPLGCVTMCIVGFLFLRNMRDVFKPEVNVSIDTLIIGIRKMNMLKPYRVVTAGFSEANYSIGDRSAVLKYQYKGMAEYSVDLSTIKCINKDDNLELELCEPILEKPIMLNIPNPRLWSVEAPLGKGNECDEWFRKEEGRIVANRIRTDVDTEENRKKAKEQTEVTLRYMFSPLIEDVSKIKFIWKSKDSIANCDPNKGE